MSGIRLSPKHGVNPSLGTCYFCGGPDGAVYLPGRLPNDAEAPRSGVWSMQPCETCAGWMAKGIMLLSVKDGEPQSQNPYRTGSIVVITAESAERMFSPAIIDTVLRHRYAFVEDAAWDEMGLPRVTVKPIESSVAGSPEVKS